MREYWDDRADEDAFYFVDSRVPYRGSDRERFWAGGPGDLDAILGRLGVEVSAGDEVVEIGCGVGRLTRPLAARGRTVRAVDVSGRMLELARRHNPDLDNVTWVLGDGTSLTAVADASADVCLSHVVFQHIPDPQVTLGYVREMGRVLRPGGWAAFQISNQPGVHRRRPLGERLKTLPARALRRRPRGQAHPAWLGSSVDLDQLRVTASQAGMHVDRVVGEGTQWCAVLARKPPPPSAPERRAGT